jgi:predicted metal-dependent phosphoesterase TrpH
VRSSENPVPGATYAIADVHTHTMYSDGQDSPLAVLQEAVRRGIRVLAITDHDTIEGALQAAALAQGNPDLPDVITGEEVSSRAGHILGLFLNSWIPPALSAEETVERIHDQGGIAVAPHAFWRSGRYGVGPQILDRVPFDAIELINGAPAPSMWRANRRASGYNRGRGLAAVGGSDAHSRRALGWGSTLFQGVCALDLRQQILAGATRPVRRRANLLDLTRYVGGAVLRHPFALLKDA